MQNVIISENSDGYGVSSDAQIEAVKTRMEIIAREMGLPTRHADTQLGSPSDSHDATEMVFELAMQCLSHIPDNYSAAVAVADRECPLPVD